MKILPDKLSRYAAVAALLVKYGRSSASPTTPILASLIVGAAMMMRIETNFRIMGYPGLAMMLFALAATGAGYMAVQIMLHDRAPKRR